MNRMNIFLYIVYTNTSLLDGIYLFCNVLLINLLFTVESLSINNYFFL